MFVYLTRCCTCLFSAQDLIFAASASRIMWCFFYAPSLLPTNYLNWISRLAQLDPRIKQLLVLARRGDWVYQKRATTEALDLASSLSRSFDVPFSAIDPLSISSVPCLMVHGQTNTPYCTVNTVRRLIGAFLQSFATIYLPLNILSSLLRPARLQKAPLDVLTAILRSSARSSAFLSSFVAICWGAICCTRRYGTLLGLSQQVLDGGLAPAVGCMLCGFAILSECFCAPFSFESSQRR